MKMEKFKTVCKEGLKELFTKFNDNLDIYTTVFVSVTYHLIFEKDFACSCKPQNQQKWACWLHLFLPWGLLWALLLLLNKSIHRAVGNVICCKSGKEDTGTQSKQQPLITNESKIQQPSTSGGLNQESDMPGTGTQSGESKTPTGSLLGGSMDEPKSKVESETQQPKKLSGRPSCRCTCWCTVILNVVYALCVSSIWVASVLLDGDWLLCCGNDGSEVQAQVACEPPAERNKEQKSIAAHLKSISRGWGLVELLLAAFGALLVTFCRECCKRQDDELTEIIFDKGRDLVFKRQRKAAMEQLEQRVKTHLEQKEWTKCSQAVEQLIIEMKDNQTSPRKDDQKEE